MGIHDIQKRRIFSCTGAESELYLIIGIKEGRDGDGDKERNKERERERKLWTFSLFILFD